MSITIQQRDFTESLHSKIQKLLDAISNFEFTLPNGLVFKISDINQNVPVYMDTSKTRMEECEMKWGELLEKINQLEREQQQLEHKRNRTREESDRYEYLFGLIRQLKKTAEDYREDHPDPHPDDIVTFSRETVLDGYYTRNGKSHNPEIVLLMETLGNDRWNAEDVAITLVHEMFHAFYDSDLSQADNYLPYVEEPLTEYAMLKFMEALSESDNTYHGLFEDARLKVRWKQSKLGIAHYGFGYCLWKYEKESGETPENIQWIEAFRKAKYKIWHKSQEYIEYAKPFKQGLYPFGEEEYQMELLRVILYNADVCLPLPQKRQANHPGGTLPWDAVDSNTHLALVNDILYLDGDYTNQFIYEFHHKSHKKRRHNTPLEYQPDISELLYFKINSHPISINRIVLWDHFICDDFQLIKRITFDTQAYVELSVRNPYFTVIDGCIYDANVTVLLYCPEDATECMIPDGVREIEWSAIHQCESLRHLSLPSSLKSIADGSFCDCKSLEDEIIFEQKLLNVPKTATSYVVPRGVKEISYYALYHCVSLRHLQIPLSVKTIGEGGFSYCESLEDEIVFEHRLLCAPRTATEYVIPNEVQEIGSRAFDDCKVLKRVTIQGNVKEIPNHTFSECDNLESLTINEGLEKIGTCAFRGCRLSDVTLPASLKEIGSWAFFECPMETLTFKGVDPPVVTGTRPMELKYNCTLYVPTGSEDAYAKAFPGYEIREY